ncbi:MAG: HAMP domain-containing sensor histidine kinase [Pseudomonadota bacterium]
MSTEIAKLKGHLKDVGSSANATLVLLNLTEARGTLMDLILLAEQDVQLSVNLAEVEAKLLTLEGLIGRTSGNQSAIAATDLRLVETVGQIDRAITSLNIETGAEVEALILSRVGEFDKAAVATGISDLNLAAQIKSMFDRQTDLQASLSAANSGSDVREIENRISFNLRTIVGSFSLLSNRPERQPLAKSVKDLREILFDDAGYLALKKTKFELLDAYQIALGDILGAVERISLQFNQGVDEARFGIEAAATSIDKTVARTIMLLSVLSVAILALAFIIAFFFFERRIIHRLSMLTASVRQIASGDTNWPVTVSGGDEFGEMADALEVFKRNLMELHRSNEELGRFAYAASHDLKSPLRAIHDLAAWTIEDAGDQLTEDCSENLEMILRRSARLSHLLEDLLSYAQVGQHEHSLQEVLPEEMIRDIADVLALEDRFKLRVQGDLAGFETYAAPLRQILLNFITNAMKHHDRDTGLISVTFQNWNGRVRIEVADDGPGIPPEFHGRVFELFKTLKSRDAVEGSGMGLAIIRKQVEHYGGVVEITSDPNRERGTTFSFDWPMGLSATVKKLAA